MWLYGQKLVKVIYHPAKFGVQSKSGNREIKVFIYVTLQDQLIKALNSDFMVGTPLGKSPPKQAISAVVVEM